RALRFRGARPDQELAIPLGDIHAVTVGPSHNGRRWWRGTVLQVRFGGGETRVLGLHMEAGDAEEWCRRLRQLTGR
ncbi:MAG: hypothetical protein ABIS47_03055, partial [Acidimicrobiales bacterium]